MPITRHPNDLHGVIEYTDQILEIPNTSSFIKDRGLFVPTYSSQMAVMFDRDEIEHTLLRTVNRRGGKPTNGGKRSSTPYTLPLAYFHDIDNIVKADYESKRRSGTPDQKDTLANVTAQKLEDQRRKVDETHEYMMLQALKGSCVTPDGVTLADMFTEFNITQAEIDFLLGTATTNVKAKCAQVKDTMQKNLKTGGRLSGDVPVLVDRLFFDKLVNHADVKEAYLNSQSNTVYQNLNSEYLTWGITDVFRFQGLMFMVYEHDFPLPSGSSVAAIADNTGHVIPNTSNSIFKAVWGPSRRMDIEGGSEMFARVYRDPREMFHEVEVETACLFYCEKPAALVKVISSN